MPSVSDGALGFAQHGAEGGFVMASATWGWAAMQQQAVPSTAAHSRAETLVHDLKHQEWRAAALPPGLLWRCWGFGLCGPALGSSAPPRGAASRHNKTSPPQFLQGRMK